MSLLAPLALAGLLLAIPIILMYMLRLRRREVVVSSTYLWQQLLQDKEANTPWQKLRRNLLLILQLIILALLAFALARPFITVPAVSAARVALLLDASASMNAADGPDGAARFVQAQAEAIGLINALSAGGEVSVIRVADPPEVLIPYTQDKAAAEAAVRGATPGQGGADWLAGLTLAAAGGQAVDDFSMVLITDGGMTGLDDLSESVLPGRVRVLPVGSSGENIALSALAARALGGGEPQLFAQITNYGDREAEVVFTLRADGDPVPVFSDRFTIAPGASQPFVSSRGLSGFEVLQASLTASVNSVGQDLLAEDNTAWTVARAAGERRILIVTEENLFLEQVFRSLPGLELFRIPPDQPLPSEAFDLYVFDRTVPESLPQGDMLFIAPPEGDVAGLFRVTGEIQGVSILETNSEDERMTFVDFDSVSVLKYRAVDGLGWADTLVSADGRPLVAAGDRGGIQIGVFAFALNDSDLPLQIAFPVLISNLLEWFTPVGSILNPTPRVGEPVLIRPPLDADAVRVTGPDGAETTLPADGDQIVFTNTSQPGVYQLEVFSGGDLLQTQAFAVNLFAPVESAIAPRDVELNGVVVARQSADEMGQFEFWPLVALLALAVLMLEWWFYQRRTRVRTKPVTGGARTASRSRAARQRT